MKNIKTELMILLEKNSKITTIKKYFDKYFESNVIYEFNEEENLEIKKRKKESIYEYLFKEGYIYHTKYWNQPIVKSESAFFLINSYDFLFMRKRKYPFEEMNEKDMEYIKKMKSKKDINYKLVDTDEELIVKYKILKFMITGDDTKKILDIINEKNIKFLIYVFNNIYNSKIKPNYFNKTYYSKSIPLLMLIIEKKLIHLIEKEVLFKYFLNLKETHNYLLEQILKNKKELMKNIKMINNIILENDCSYYESFLIKLFSIIKPMHICKFFDYFYYEKYIESGNLYYDYSYDEDGEEKNQKIIKNIMKILSLSDFNPNLLKLKSFILNYTKKNKYYDEDENLLKVLTSNKRSRDKVIKYFNYSKKYERTFEYIKLQNNIEKF